MFTHIRNPSGNRRTRIETWWWWWWGFESVWWCCTPSSATRQWKNVILHLATSCWWSATSSATTIMPWKNILQIATCCSWSVSIICYNNAMTEYPSPPYNNRVMINSNCLQQEGHDWKNALLHLATSTCWSAPIISNKAKKQCPPPCNIMVVISWRHLLLIFTHTIDQQQHLILLI